ncbi:MAG: T9SS type A sorting domain-containing protein [Cytophagales bacterium]|nr:T9SS type A sorting domain-containing protein [Cytophaga sp.]
MNATIDENFTAAADILIYPNPFNDAASISYSEIEKAQSISIYNSAGILVEFYDDKKNFRNNMVVGSTLPTGIYIFKIGLEDDVRTFRIIKN